MKEKYDTLNATLPVLKDFLSGNCCKAARRKLLGEALLDIFKILEVKVDKSEVKKTPGEYYKKLRKMILEDGSLSSTQKINLVKLM